jgi:hypothetical protein
MIIQINTFNHQSTKRRAFQAHYPKATSFGGGNLLEQTPDRIQ